jgi:hypothetical protein
MLLLCSVRLEKAIKGKERQMCEQVFNYIKGKSLSKNIG